MSARDVAIKKNRYFDSVFLMAVARRLAEQPGIEDAAAVMGSAANKLVLIKMGFAEAALRDAGPNDLVVVLHGRAGAVNGLLTNIEQWLVRPKSTLDEGMALSLDDAWEQQDASNLAVISVPGEYAAREAQAALDHGMNVFLFSDHVAIEDELELKQRANKAGLIVMGPDCGTAILCGVGIGFSNAVRWGAIGVIGSTGTGLQEFTCLVHRAGGGISHAIGTGSRDLSDAIGGISTLTALRELEKDEATEAISILSKPPGVETLDHIIDRLNQCSKPVVACFLGLERNDLQDKVGFRVSSTLDEATEAALKLTSGEPACSMFRDPTELKSLLEQECVGMIPEQKYVRGLFAGGTFCYQGQQIMREGGIVVHSNSPLAAMHSLPDARRSLEHTFVDMGDDQFTAGRPHPMIDATQRHDRILFEADDPKIAVLLLDFILGYNSSPNPVGDLVDAIAGAKRKLEQAGGYLSVVASVCGTERDPQDLNQQEKALRDAGVVVFSSNAQACYFAREVLRERSGEGHSE